MLWRCFPVSPQLDVDTTAPCTQLANMVIYPLCNLGQAMWDLQGTTWQRRVTHSGGQGAWGNGLMHQCNCTAQQSTARHAPPQHSMPQHTTVHDRTAHGTASQNCTTFQGEPSLKSSAQCVGSARVPPKGSEGGVLGGGGGGQQRSGGLQCGSWWCAAPVWEHWAFGCRACADPSHANIRASCPTP